MTSWLERLRKRHREISFKKELTQISHVNHSFDPILELKDTPRGKTEQLILSWANGLPTSPKGILDLAAGQGIESQLLSSGGHRVEAYDISSDMVKGGSFKVNQKDITKLRLKRNSYSGALIKDSWVFISPDERLKVLSMLRNALVTSGSLLVITQTSSGRANLVPHDSSYPLSIPQGDFSSIEEWARKIKQEKSLGGKVFSIEFETNQTEFFGLASRTGFRCRLTPYDSHSVLAQENRWLKREGLIVVLTKTSN